MGSNPGNSVTNSCGQVWDTPNVFVTGAALFPQNAGMNPSATVGALACRTAEALRDRYYGAPGELLTRPCMQGIHAAPAEVCCDSHVCGAGDGVSIGV